MKYEAHGHYKLWCEQNTLFAELSGAWNMEAALAYERDFMEYASAFDQDWAHIVFLDHWELGTPEINIVVERLVGWCITNGLKRAANVYKPSGLKNALLKQMIVEEHGDFKRAVFDNPTTAAQWLSDEGFRGDS